MKSTSLSLFIVLIFAYSGSAGEIYDYTDEEGNTNYTNVPTKNQPNSGDKDQELLKEFGEDVEIIKPSQQEKESNQVELEIKKDTVYLDHLRLELVQIDNKLLSISDEIDHIKSSIPSSSMQVLDYTGSNRLIYSECLRILEDDTYITQYQFYNSYYWGTSGTSVTYPAVDPNTKVYCKQLIQERKDRELLFEQGNAKIDALESQYDELYIYRESIVEQIRKYEE